MLNKVCSMSFRKVFLISNDNFLCLGIKSLPDIKKSVECIKLDAFSGSDVKGVDIVLLDLLSWQTGGTSIKNPLSEFTDTSARLVMITSGIFQELLTDMLYPEILKISRGEMIYFINKLCGVDVSYRFKPSPERKVRKFLTKREFDILGAFLSGSRSEIIGSKFNIHQKTVSSHKLSALGKIGCKNMAHFYTLSRPFICDLNLLSKGTTGCRHNGIL